jgi:hypothetical protein
MNSVKLKKFDIEQNWNTPIVDEKVHGSIIIFFSLLGNGSIIITSEDMTTFN